MNDQSQQPEHQHHSAPRHDPHEKTRTYTGGCHCGTVRFRVQLDLADGITRCNCSICTKVGGTGAISRPEAFTLLSPEEACGTYAWGGRTGVRYFCKSCGIHCFLRGSLPELGGAYVAINCNTLDHFDPYLAPVRYWDGRHDNWMAGAREAPWPIAA